MPQLWTAAAALARFAAGSWHARYSSYSADPLIQIILGAATALGGAALGLLGAVIATRSASGASQRSDVLLHLRWGTEMVLSSDDRTSLVGVQVLRALEQSALVGSQEASFVSEVLNAVLPQDLPS